MQRCKFCGSALPARARFCGSCGRTLHDVGDRATELSDTPTLDLPASESAAQTPPIKPVRLQPLDDAAENQYPGATERYPWPGADSEQLPTLADSQQNDEDEWQRRGMILGAPFLTMLAEDAQAPAGNVPMVQGTPQASGLPMVQGTPQAPVNPPAGQLYVQNPAPSAPSTTPNAGSWMPHTPPPQHVTGEFTAHHLSGELAHHHVSGELPTGPLNTPHHRARSRRWHLHGPHRLVSILIVTTIAIVVIVTSGIGIGLAIFHPSLSLSGSSSVVSGGTMSLHGRNFIPGSTVTLTLDNGLPLAYAGHGLTRQAGSYAAGLATAFQVSAAGQLAQPTNAPVPVNVTGAFDITIPVSESWSPGPHTIHAMDSVLGRSAELQFTVVPKQGRLELRPSTLDFGKLQQGTKAILSVVLSNTGKHPLTWQAALARAASTNWLKVQPAAGTIEPGAEQFIYVIADTGGLKVGPYSATLDIRSDAGNVQVPVNLQVIPPGKPQAHLVVNPQKLDFGQLVAGNQSMLPITIGNAGTQALDWKATTGNASWLTLDSNNGTVKPGGLPHVIQVTADATGLAAGNYSATLSITSNGGSAQVTVTMVVTPSNPNGPPPPPKLASSPGSFNVPGDPNCTYNAQAGWTCVVSLSSSQSAQANLNWTASSSGVNGVTFSQASGTLSPGQTAQVSISIPNTVCPSQADFTFTGPGNAPNVLWSCAPPNLTATPTTTFSTGCLSCSVMLALAPGSQGGLQWSASSSISEATFKPASGILLGTKTTQVSITVPSTTCPPTADFTFTGPVNTAKVTWNCVPPKLAVSPDHFASTDCQPTGQGWNCTATLTNLDSLRSLSWSSTSSGINGITFTPPGSAIPVNQSVKVIIFVPVPNTICPVNADLVFTGPQNTVHVPWSCQPPGIQVSPTSFNANTDCSYAIDTSSPGWTCQAMVTDPDSLLRTSWSASASVAGITFTPANGTIPANQSAPVTIFVPNTICPAKADLVFTGPQNTVHVPWSCSAPSLSATPSGINANTDCSYSANTGWTCPVTLSSSSSNQGDLAWSASSSAGISFSQPNGTLSPGASQQIQIFVSAATVCPASASLAFSGPANTVSVSWSCIAPTLSVSPSSLGLGSSNCQSGQTGYTCTVILSDDQGGANWSASSAINSVNISPSSGTVYPSGTTITISNIPCNTVTISFAGPANTATASWTCIS